MLAVAVLVLGTVMTSLIAMAVFIKNSRSVTNRLFVGLAFALVGLSVTTYFSLHTSTDQQTLAWMRPIMFFVVLQNTILFLLVKIFPASEFNLFRRPKYRLAIAYAAIVAIVALTPLLFADFKDGSPVPGPGMALFLIHAILFVGGGMVYLVKRFRRAKGVERAQLQYFAAGTILLLTLLPVSNFVAPVVFQSSQFVTFSPLYLIVFAALFAYAIVAKRMFDIRAAVARSVAYVLSLGFIGVVYGISVLLTVTLLDLNRISITVERAIFVGFALFTAVLYPYIRRAFDRITNRVFFRDAYDTEEFLDGLNRSLVTKVDLEPLLSDVATLIEQNLKSEYCVFAIRETSYFPQRVIGTKDKHLSAEDIEQLHETIPRIHHRVIVADQLEAGEYSSLARLLVSNDIAVLARLVTTVKYNVEGIGYLILGPKKSGNPYTRQDENTIKIVANELVIAIQNALRFEEIEEFNVTLQQKVDSATRKLRRTNEKLEALDETKDEFISMASHQLRTPLTSVKGYISMVMEGDAGKISANQKKLLDQAFISSQRMVYLIADLLNVSRLKTGKFIIENHPTNLAEVVEGEISQLVETAASRGLELKYAKPDNFPALMLDETKIRQVIMNFVDNAIYYTPSGGHIKVELRETDKAIEFRVIDDGIGIPKHEQHHMFTKFYRAGNAKKARPDGTGLGIFMAKKVVVAQGGSLIFSSEEGKGSTFGFSFSKDKLAPNDDHRAQDNQ